MPCYSCYVCYTLGRPTVLLAIFAAIGTAIVLCGLYIDDQIERRVCARDNRRYSPWWIVFRPAGLRLADASAVGLLTHKVAVLGVFLAYGIVFVSLRSRIFGI